MSLQEFSLIESTLREGEQFVGADFSPNDKIEIAHALDDFGVEYIEVTSPCASPQSQRDCETLAQLNLRARVLTHIRCHREDARIALDTGVDGIDIVIGTSSYLREFSHGKAIGEIIELAAEVLTLIRQPGARYQTAFFNRGLIPQRPGRLVTRVSCC